MTEYNKPWLSIPEQVDRLEARGVQVPARAECEELLRMVGYYRLTGYLYPFRDSETYRDEDGSERVRILNHYRDGTSVAHAAALIEFDRSLRMSVLDGIERIEVALRMQVGFVLGRVSAFAHLEPSTFVESFVVHAQDESSGDLLPSKHDLWLERIRDRQNDSDEAFVAHFRSKYDDKMPIWALTEIMEMGHVGRLYGGLRNDLASEIAAAFGVPSKKLMSSWISSLNYVRNVAAHHARLFNRKLVIAPSRPRGGEVPVLSHLRGATAKEAFGVYNALAVMAFLLRQIDPRSDWRSEFVNVVDSFPNLPGMTIASMGFPQDWRSEALWAHAASGG